jgi:hypothetical protein
MLKALTRRPVATDVRRRGAVCGVRGQPLVPSSKRGPIPRSQAKAAAASRAEQLSGLRSVSETTAIPARCEASEVSLCPG